MKHPPRNIVVDWLNTIWQTDLPYQSKYLACYLRKFMNSEHDMAYPSYARIIAETGLSRMTVSRYLERLEGEGWIVRDRGHKGKNTTYIACFPTSITERLVSERYQASTTQSKTSIREVHELNNNKQVINNNKEFEIPEGINLDAWHEWVDYRKSKKKKISEAAAKKQFKLLLNYNHIDQQSIIDKSISNDYQGLFELKGVGNAKNNQSNKTRRPSAVDRTRIANEERERIRQAQARESDGQALAAINGDVRPSTSERLRGDNTGELGEIIDGCFTAADR